MADRSVEIRLERELVMRCAERATSDGIGTAQWINRELEKVLSNKVSKP